MPGVVRRPARALQALSLVVILGGLVTRACADNASKPNGGAAGDATNQPPIGDGGTSDVASGGKSGDTAVLAAGAGGIESTMPTSTCGNGQIDAGEECDDGNTASGDGCSYRCTNACETCERDVCPTTTPFNAHPWYSYAYTMDGDAEAGPGKGKPRAELVRDVLQCVYDARCTLVFSNDPPITSQISLRECFCKNAPAGTAPATYPDICKNDTTRVAGPCLNQMLAAAETDTVDVMLTKLTNLSTALGRAFYLLQHCDARVCGAQCLPTETGL